MSDVPPPLIEIAIEPKAKGDREKMSQALALLATEDPSFRVAVDHESGQTIIMGMSEAHLEAMVDRLNGEFKVEANIGAPQVAYRETISRQAMVDYTHQKLAGAPRQSAPAKIVPISPSVSFTFDTEPVARGSAEYARVLMTLEPLPLGSGFAFVNEVADGTVPQEYLPGVETGIKGSLDDGVLAGFPVVDLKVTLTGGAYHEGESSALAFEFAARAAMKEGLGRAAPKLLEPIMKVEVVTPRDYMGDVIGDINSRRGRFTGQDQRGNAEVIIALVPLSNLFGYTSDLNALSRERATFSMQFAHYDRVPKSNDDDGDPPFRPAVGMRP